MCGLCLHCTICTIYMGRYIQSWAFDFFVGIFSGWRMDVNGGIDMVDPEEEQGIFKIRGEALILNFR